MLNIISDEQINIELKPGFKPPALDSGITVLPFSDLSDREFELFAYLLVKKEIGDDLWPNITDISLMQGVGEKGRDCVLYKGGEIKGLIQCKKYSGRFTRPQSIKEIIKFLLFSTLDKDLLPNPEDFEYLIYVSNDFTGPAISLVHSFSNEIEKEIESGEVNKYIKDIVHEYESFSCYAESLPFTKVKKLLRKIKVSSSNSTELNMRVNGYSDLYSMFFNVKKVADLDGADKLIRSALDDYGLKLMTDGDLKKLQERIGSMEEKNRIKLGVVDFFGVGMEFFKFLSGDRFLEVIKSVMKAKSVLDKYLIEFISLKIKELTMNYITNDLLKNKKIHAFSVGIAEPYLQRRLQPIVLSSLMPKEMFSRDYPHFFMPKDELVSEVSQTLFATSERVMRGDHSRLVGNQEDLEFKIKLFDHMHEGFVDINDAKVQFEKDMVLISPVLDRIEGEIKELIRTERTIVINDASFIDDNLQLTEFMETITALG